MKNITITKKIIAIIIIITTISLFFIIILQSQSTPPKENEQIELSTIDFSHLKYSDSDLDKIELMIDITAKVLSQIYPENKTYTIKNNSPEMDDLSFILISENNTTFFLKLSDETLIIKDKDNIVFYQTSLSFFPDHPISSNLVDQYFPYIDYSSNNEKFTANLSSDKKEIKIKINYCSEPEIEAEILRKTKQYITDINANPSSFTYSISNLCF